jgi:hypothetical protein
MKGTGRAGRLVAIATLSVLAACARAPIETDSSLRVADAERTDRADARPPIPALEPAAARTNVPRFDMLPGTTLRETLERWAVPSGWTVRWASDRTYPIKGRASFDGDFVQAAGDLIRSFRQLNPPPIARFYLRNHELRIVTPGDEMGE